MFAREVKKPEQLFHVLVDSTDLPVNAALKGMCLNGTRVMRWASGMDVNLSPLAIPKESLLDYGEELLLHITVDSITSATDYQIFNAFKMQNLSKVIDLIDEHKGINAVDEWGHTMLMLATQAGSIDIVARLLNTRMPKVNVNAAKAVR